LNVPVMLRGGVGGVDETIVILRSCQKIGDYDLGGVVLGGIGCQGK